MEPRYNEVLGTRKITLLYQVSHYIRVKKPKKYKELGPAKLPCYKRVLLYPTSLYCAILNPRIKVMFSWHLLTAWWRFSMHRRCPSASRFFLLFWTPVSDVFLASTITTWWRFSMHISHVHLAAQGGGGGGLNPIVWGWAWDRVL